MRINIVLLPQRLENDKDKMFKVLDEPFLYILPLTNDPLFNEIISNQVRIINNNTFEFYLDKDKEEL